MESVDATLFCLHLQPRSIETAARQGGVELDRLDFEFRSLSRLERVLEDGVRLDPPALDALDVPDLKRLEQPAALGEPLFAQDDEPLPVHPCLASVISHVVPGSRKLQHPAGTAFKS